MNVQIGSMNKRIDIIRKAKTYDKDGYAETSNLSVYRCWASFSRSSGRETYQRNADMGVETVRFLIRTPPVKINRKMYIIYDNREYAITYINDYQDARQYTEIYADRKTEAAV